MAIFYAIGSFIFAWWWLICLLFAVIFIFKYGSGINKGQNEGLRYSTDDSESAKNSFTYLGDPELTNDSYIIFLTKRFGIEKSEVLGKYIVSNKLFATLQEALEAGDQLYKEWSVQQVDQNNIALQNLAIRKTNFQRFLIFCAVVLAILFIYKSPIGHVITTDIFSPEDKRPGIMAPALPLVTIENSKVSPAITPSFDCSKAKSISEKLICSDKELANEDNELFVLYSKAKANTYDPVGFKTEAAEAWKVREKNCLDKQCLLDWFETRKSYYQGVISQEIEYSKFSEEDRALIKKWSDGLRKGTGDYWDADIRKKLNQDGICWGISGQSRAEYDWHKCTSKSFKDY